MQDRQAHTSSGDDADNAVPITLSLASQIGELQHHHPDGVALHSHSTVFNGASLARAAW
jgi:hypothetical protein